MSLNKVILIGNVGKDPEIRSTQDGREIANFSLATTESWKDKNSGERQTKTEWHNITAFGAVVGVIKNYVKKGSKLYIEGQLQTSKYTDKQGVEKYATKVILQAFSSRLLMLDTKSKEEGYKPTEKQVASHDAAFAAIEDDDIPF